MFRGLITWLGKVCGVPSNESETSTLAANSLGLAPDWTETAPHRQPLQAPFGALPWTESERSEKEYRAWLKLALDIFSGLASAGIRVRGDLTLATLRIRALPQSMSVKGHLDLRQCQRLRHIGDGLDVRGDLTIGGQCDNWLFLQQQLSREKGTTDLLRGLKRPSRDSQCPLKSLPNNLTVGGNVSLRSCHEIVELPRKSKLGGDILIEGCRSFCRLPKAFAVKGNLTIKGCPGLTELPRSLHVQGDLRLIGVPINCLPDDLRIGGALLLETCNRLKQLPTNLAVADDLILRQSNMAQLPAGLKVGRHLIVERCSAIETVPRGVQVAGDIRLRRCAGLLNIPTGIHVAQSLKLPHCPKLRDLPEGLHVPGLLDLRGDVSITRLPPRLKIGHGPARSPHEPALILSDCENLTSLPEDLTVDGAIDVAGSGLTDLPAAMERCRIVWRAMVVHPNVVFHPEKLPPQQILDERNTELQQLMLERVGVENVLSQANATIIDEDTDSGGPRRLVDVTLQLRTRRYLHRRGPSTQHEYLIRVPTPVSTCRAAAAWLASFEYPNEHQPIQETIGGDTAR